MATAEAAATAAVGHPAVDTSLENDGDVVASGAQGKPYTCCCSVTFDSPEHAIMVMNALSVDKELRPDNVLKAFKTAGNTLTIDFAATDVRFLRSAVGSTCDLMGVAVRTLEAFAPAATPVEPLANLAVEATV